MSLEINLLHKHKTSKFTQRVILSIRIATVVIGATVLLSLSVLFYLKKNAQVQLIASQQYHDKIMSSIQKKQDIETGAILLNEKYKGIHTVITSELPYSVYFQTLFKELPNSSESGRITNLSMNKKGEATTQLLFPNILALTKFLSRIESESFQKQFFAVKTSGLSFSQEGSKEILFSLDVSFR